MRFDEMAALGSKIRVGQKRGAPVYFVFCPGCNDVHAYDDRWLFNGDTEKPTFTPSYLARGEHICHSFLQDGIFRFLNDCTHKLADQKVEVPNFDERQD